MSSQESTEPKASPQPPRATRANEVLKERKERAGELPAGNATRELEKPDARQRAQADQSTLQDKGGSALPGSDYPAKDTPARRQSG